MKRDKQFSMDRLTGAALRKIPRTPARGKLFLHPDAGRDAERIGLVGPGDWVAAAAPGPVRLSWSAGELVDVLGNARGGEAVAVTFDPDRVTLVRKPGYPAALDLARWLREQDPEAPVWADLTSRGMVVSLRTA